MDIRLEKKVAFICGSSDGLGLAVAERFAEMGARCILAARSEEKLKNICDNLNREYPNNHSYIAVDFQDYNNAIEVIKNSDIPNIDILVNNAGGPAPGLAKDAKPEDFLKAFERHLFFSQHLVNLFVPYMQSQNWGRILNIISVSVKQPIPNLGVSNTLRGAMSSWAKTLSNELGQFGITVNNILPGQTKTKRLESLIENNSKKQNISYSDLEKNMISDIPVSRFGEPWEFAAAAGFLASEFASFINGVNLPIDGGFIKGL